jgi:hypothetical protein
MSTATNKKLNLGLSNITDIEWLVSVWPKFPKIAGSSVKT